ncbi:hypothetical protein GR248_24315 [Rhizobium leguminosarum]|uniref:hypothetical protein n=1 Tax=Rhizobium leguminosarum TaxID=384 RepID=UPI0013C90704|nr:hypothetical protein [Rhizobium leguminosarum]NEI93926.1 hypothetical protein [Rhizobium leguminosarum]
MSYVADARPGSSTVARQEIDSQICDWLEHGTSQYFHLIGSPGSGKTTWLQGLVERRKVLSKTGALLAVIAANHFCQWDDASSSSAVGFLRKISQQLAQFDPAYANALVREAERSRNISVKLVQNVWDAPGAIIEGPKIGTINIHGEKPADIIDSLFRLPLREALVDQGPIWLLIVDAPDEPAAPDVADLLLSLGILPSRFRIIIATRANADMARGLSMLGAEACSLSTLEGTAESVTRYLQNEVALAKLDARVELNFGTVDLVRALSARAGENFLVARCALQAVSEGLGPITAAVVADLPDNLSGYYRLFLSRLDRDTKRSWAKEGGPVLGALATARSPLGEADVASLSEISTGIVRQLFTQLRSFIEPVGMKRWRLFHATFAEFLLDEADAEEFWCPAEEQHGRIVRWVLGENDALPDWNGVPEYGVHQILYHVVEANSRDVVRQLDAIISEAYLQKRFQLGATVFELSSDFRRALKAASDRAAVTQTLFFASLLAYWQDRIAADADPSSTILLAALGRVDEAVQVALRQDEAAHADAYDGIRHQEEFASNLIRLGEVDAAIDFARRIEGEARGRVCWAAFNALAVEDPQKALGLRSLEPFDGPLQLWGDAFTALASVPDGLHPALSAASSSEDFARIAEGCARHDLDQALTLASNTDSFTRWLGGEYFRFKGKDGAANVLAAFIVYNPELAADAWQRADQELGQLWPMPYGLLLAGRFAEFAPEMGQAAFERLGLTFGSLSHLLASAWMGSLGGEVLSAELVRALGKASRATESEDEWLSAQFDGVGLRHVLQQLALIEPYRIPRDSRPFQLLEIFGERLLIVLSEEKDVPEKKARGARVLGEIYGWLGDDFISALFRLGTDKWGNESWQRECGEGLAASLARRGVANYIAARNDLSGYAWQQSAVQIASDIIASENPKAILQLIDSIDIRYSATRAQLVGTAAVAMKRSGVGSLDALPPRLSPYIDGAEFRNFLDILKSIAEPSEVGSNLPMEAIAKLAVDAAIRNPKQNGMHAIALVEDLNDGVGIPFEGEIIWAKDLRRKLADALSASDPAAALRLINPFTDTRGFTEFAQAFRGRHPDLAEWHPFAEWTCAAIQRLASSHWPTDLVVGFALALPEDSRHPFLATVVEEGSSTYRHIRARLQAFEQPAKMLELAGMAGAGENPNHNQAIRDSIQVLADRGDPSLFDLLSRVYKQVEPSDGIVKQIGLSWPANDWKTCLAACEDWFGQNMGWDQKHLFLHLIESLLPRAATISPKSTFAIVDQLATTYSRAIDKPHLLRLMIGSIVGGQRPSAEHWSALLSAAKTISESRPLGNALLETLRATRRLDTKERQQATCQTIAALALSSRELVLKNVEAIYWAAIDSAPEVKSALPNIASRLKVLLSTSPNSLAE